MALRGYIKSSYIWCPCESVSHLSSAHQHFTSDLHIVLHWCELGPHVCLIDY